MLLLFAADDETDDDENGLPQPSEPSCNSLLKPLTTPVNPPPRAHNPIPFSSAAEPVATGDEPADEPPPPPQLLTANIPKSSTLSGASCCCISADGEGIAFAVDAAAAAAADVTRCSRAAACSPPLLSPPLSMFKSLSDARASAANDEHGIEGGIVATPAATVAGRLLPIPLMVSGVTGDAGGDAELSSPPPPPMDNVSMLAAVGEVVNEPMSSAAAAVVVATNCVSVVSSNIVVVIASEVTSVGVPAIDSADVPTMAAVVDAEAGDNADDGKALDRMVVVIVEGMVFVMSHVI